MIILNKTQIEWIRLYLSNTKNNIFSHSLKIISSFFLFESLESWIATGSKTLSLLCIFKLVLSSSINFTYCLLL